MTSLRKVLGFALLGVMLSTAVPVFAASAPGQKKGTKKGGKKKGGKAGKKGGGRGNSL
jgi:hypothetical protein